VKSPWSTWTKIVTWTRPYIPSGGLTLIVGTQKWGVSCKVQRRPPADIFLNESLPKKTPLRTPCSWPPWPWFSREILLKILKVSWKKKLHSFDPYFKTLYLARKWVQRAHIGLVWKLCLRATQSILQHFRSDHLLEHSEAMNELQKKKKKKRSNDLLERSKFRQQVHSFFLRAFLKACDFQIFGIALKCLRGNLSTKNFFF
jgi:hypothetical protein